MADARSGVGGGRDWLAVGVGALRCASGISFLVAPEAADRLWGGEPDDSPKAGLLLHSMGFRDALVGGMLAWSGWTGRTTAGWFLASGGADASDLLGGTRHHHEMSERAIRIGLGGAAFGIAVAILGATRSRQEVRREPSRGDQSGMPD